MHTEWAPDRPVFREMLEGRDGEQRSDRYLFVSQSKSVGWCIGSLKALQGWNKDQVEQCSKIDLGSTIGNWEGI